MLALLWFLLPNLVIAVDKLLGVPVFGSVLQVIGAPWQALLELLARSGVLISWP